MRRAASSRRAGFTLIEMAFVVTILGILASIALPSYTSSLIRADAAEIGSRLNTAELGVRESEAMSGRIPADRVSPGTVPPGLTDFVPEDLFRSAFGVTMQYVALNGTALGTGGRIAGVYLASTDERGAEVLDALTHLYPHPVLRMSGGILVPFGAQVARRGVAAGGGAGTPSTGSTPSSTGSTTSSTGASASSSGSGVSSAGSSAPSTGSGASSTGSGSGSIGGSGDGSEPPSACLGSGWLPPGQQRRCASGGGNSAWFRGHSHD